MIFKSITIGCFLSIASNYALPPSVLLGILRTEHGQVGHWSTNSNGSHDLGPMQVNDATWLKRVAELQFNGNKTRTETALIYDGCYNLNVGAWILRQYLNEADGNYFTAIGYYHSHNPAKANAYRVRFISLSVRSDSVDSSGAYAKENN
jgi:soluble lytic murein transglycosylase-like protein